jgi:hypothetical protein
MDAGGNTSPSYKYFLDITITVHLLIFILLGMACQGMIQKIFCMCIIEENWLRVRNCGLENYN